MNKSSDDERSLTWSNDRVYAEFPTHHPARLYLVRFYEVREEVCGRDIAWPDRARIEQEWVSKLLQRKFSFSAFAYCFISLTLTMDEWFDDHFSTTPSEWEQRCIAQFAMKQTLLDECAEAAEREENTAILEYVHLVRSVLELGIEATAHRISTTKSELIAQWGQEPQLAAHAWLERK